MIDKNKPLRTGELLRIVVKATGFRTYFTQNGWGQDLDDVANGKKSRAGHYELTESLARKYLDEIEKQCGGIWSIAAEKQWKTISSYIASSSQRTHKRIVSFDDNVWTPLDYVIYELMPNFIKVLSNSSFGTLKLDTWWRSPFKAWLEVASTITSVSEKKLNDAIGDYLTTESERQKGSIVSKKTLRNWRSGKPIAKIIWPHQKLVEHATGLTHSDERSRFTIKYLTGLLVLAIALQAIDMNVRSKMAKQDFSEDEEKQARKKEEAETIHEELQIRKESIDLLFYREEFSVDAVESELHTLKMFIESCPEDLGFIHEFYSARLAAFVGSKKVALDLYQKAQEGSAWVGGSDQKLILDEALVYSLGVKHKASIKRYWDCYFLFEIKYGGKREISGEEEELYSEAFHRVFPVQAEELIRDGDLYAIETQLRLGLKIIDCEFYEKPFCENRVELHLDWLKDFLINCADNLSFHYDFYSARLAAFRGLRDHALVAYCSAVEKSSLIGGQAHKDILYESFVYSTGINDLSSSRKYWCEYYKLQYNDGDPELSEDDKQQILCVFRNKFHTLVDEHGMLKDSN